MKTIEIRVPDDFLIKILSPVSPNGPREPDIEQSKDNLCILKADIKNFSKYIGQNRDIEISERFKSIVKDHTKKCKYYDVSQGDSLVIIDHNPQHIALVAQRIIDDLEISPGKPKLRVGIDFGEISYNLSKKTFNPTGGNPLRTAARIEPLVRPREIWATEGFKNLLEQYPGDFKAVKLKSEHVLSEIPHKDGKFNIKKKGSTEPDFFLKLYRIIKKQFFFCP